jgi:hypothetical protein
MTDAAFLLLNQGVMLACEKLMKGVRKHSRINSLIAFGVGIYIE